MSLDGVGRFRNLPRTEDGQATNISLEIVAVAMTPNQWFRTSAIGLIALCTSCGTDRDSTKSEPANTNLPVTRIAENEPTISFSDIELSLEVTSRDSEACRKRFRSPFATSLLNGDAWYSLVPWLKAMTMTPHFHVFASGCEKRVATTYFSLSPYSSTQSRAGSLLGSECKLFHLLPNRRSGK